MYFIYGEELFLIDKQIKKILKENSDAKSIFFDANSTIYEAINEINTFSIFDDKKIIIFKDFYLLTKPNAAHDQEMINSIKNKNENIVLIFTYPEAKPKAQTTLFKYLLKETKSIEVKKYTQMQLAGVIREIVSSKGGSITNIDSILLSTKLPNDLNLIIREIDKLLIEDKGITKEMIYTSISKYNSNNIFEFINSFQEGDVAGLFRSYKERVDNGEAIINLISQLSNALILCSSIHSYKALRMRVEEIAEEMKIHIFRVKKANELLKTMGFKRIEVLIQMLSELDTKIKNGEINEVIGFEKLLLEIIR
jgi:DNA polymerase-3 subunit delta